MSVFRTYKADIGELYKKRERKTHLEQVLMYAQRKKEILKPEGKQYNQIMVLPLH